MRLQRTVGEDALLDVGEVAALDDAVEAPGAADHRPVLAADDDVGRQFPAGLGERLAVVQLDDAGGVREQQFDGLLVDAAGDAVAATRQNPLSRRSGPMY